LRLEGLGWLDGALVILQERGGGNVHTLPSSPS
jgi:hypothetical protein